MDEMNDFFGNDEYDDQEPMGDEAIEDNTGEDGKKRVVKPPLERVKRMMNPRQVLDERTLTGPKGISALRETFKSFKPDPKSDPYANLEKMMKKYAYWGHLMFPRMKTEDVLSRVELLGTRRAVKVDLAKTRLGMEEPETSEESAKKKGGDIIDDGAEEPEKAPEPDSSPVKNQQKAESAIDFYEEEEHRMAEEERLREQREAEDADELMADFDDVNNDW